MSSSDAAEVVLRMPPPRAVLTVFFRVAATMMLNPTTTPGELRERSRVASTLTARPTLVCPQLRGQL
jgi:hypothetical protein